MTNGIMPRGFVHVKVNHYGQHMGIASIQAEHIVKVVLIKYNQQDRAQKKRGAKNFNSTQPLSEN